MINTRENAVSKRGRPPGLASAISVGSAIFVALAVLAGCSAGRAEPPLSGDRRSASNVQKSDRISVTLRSEPASVASGGSFSLTLVVRNLSGKRAEYTLPTGQTFELVAFERGGAEVWKWSKGLFFLQAVNEVILEPGGSKTFKASWNSGSSKPGLYTVQGYFLGLPDVRPAVALEITPDG